MSAYVGRFAPTPSGPLHLGSLAAAVVSWLDARSQQGRWHLRIDDIDRPRVAAGASDAILRALDCHDLGWDGPVSHQSRHGSDYQDAAERLRDAGHLFPCACSRQQVLEAGRSGWEGPIYPGTCRRGLPPSRQHRSLRLQVTQRHWTIEDRALGPVSFDLQALGGDFVVRRADGLFAYQLATVVDDLALGVTDVVRGIDLLGSVPRQMHLYRALEQSPPRYLHHPVVVARDRCKLAKSHGAAPIRCRDAVSTLARILSAIGIPDLEPEMTGGGTGAVTSLLEHALGHWHPARLPVQPIAAATLEPGG
ncbi:glutamyl-Q-tRNA synthetase [Thioalkalivibrio nitratireducens DSM 14787]|uniref:Glutamyl-Q tRNA(Asp) synthetase n=1 Tax=Thioalkalivibrio nitratireducens (strain DSM 14787 / UNIQEM 213 / ALEN2) TaxID=1255043 RepID=L0E0A8_THIND|nr:tRNA glutamyl-Q(34) synthetase GluQRS [Thioalkalivibrio nitratireducens]AGA34728.1 glutamyl-Q-tRNA synthetase [Thioalkalivibrio nitratireducens DSM 14787]